MVKQGKKTKGMAIELDHSDHTNLKIIQARYILIGVEKKLTEIAGDCLKIGIADKLANTEKL